MSDHYDLTLMGIIARYQCSQGAWREEPVGQVRQVPYQYLRTKSIIENTLTWHSGWQQMADFLTEQYTNQITRIVPIIITLGYIRKMCGQIT